SRRRRLAELRRRPAVRAGRVRCQRHRRVPASRDGDRALHHIGGQELPERSARGYGERLTLIRTATAPHSKTKSKAGGLRERQTVLVLDYGSQYSQLIARRVREASVYCELVPGDTPWSELKQRHPAGLILSGGPASVYDADAPQ